MFHERKQNGEIESNCTFTTSKDLFVEKVDCLILTPWEVPSTSNITYFIIIPSYDFLLSLLSLIYTKHLPRSTHLSLNHSLLFICFLSFLFFSFLSSLHPLNSFIHHPLQLFAHPSQLLATCLSILSAFSLPFAHIVSTLLLISVTIQKLSVRSLQPLFRL